MNELATTFRSTSKPRGDVSPRPSPTNSTETATLITEQQVRLSTAAAVALPPAKTRFSDLVEAVAAKMRVLVASPGKPPARRHYPKRHVWLENSLMSREMDRL
jgi:hypothetical protein